MHALGWLLDVYEEATPNGCRRARRAGVRTHFDLGSWLLHRANVGCRG
jgi:hypothetical protein